MLTFRDLVRPELGGPVVVSSIGYRLDRVSLMIREKVPSVTTGDCGCRPKLDGERQ
ncbi:hypothetical protein BOSEA31B_20836 [Hyphomicrobiales bacterium]|nr:hypothetical protein BOSEA31B_20836 [Hyphomicrobiales bacterium]CAH1702666.1 hypothetical protein BOSEA1005_30538 [Hyphomicrobiales bacterium]CAI0346856.1 hypothetical protein BO1005MUT1_530032 [Hyphomicrobiales bacterium]